MKKRTSAPRKTHPPKSSTPNARLIACEVLQQVITHQRSLADVAESHWVRFSMHSDKEKSQKDKAFAQTLVYGVLRFLPTLHWLSQQLLQKPLKAKDQDIQMLLHLGIYQLWALRVPAHAAISTSVELTRQMNKDWASGLVNGVLRNFQRRQAVLLAEVEQHEAAHFAHPRWWLKAWQSAWEDEWAAIALANNEPGPMSLRVNLQQQSRQAYAQRLLEAGILSRPLDHSPAGLELDKPVDITRLPDFASGAVSVQDGAAQLAATLLDAPNTARILDACAAPGGKTAHILERAPEAEVWALDADEKRLERVHETLQRLQLNTDKVQLHCADAATPETWWDQQPFSHILLDAPCSASGVIRRHPDIKYLRQATDIPILVQQQAELLEQLWALLAVDGILLYATCSVMPEENSQQIMAFLDRHEDAHLMPLQGDWGHAQAAGRQILPGEAGMDGFYYACLHKRALDSSTTHTTRDTTTPAP